MRKKRYFVIPALLLLLWIGYTWQKRNAGSYTRVLQKIRIHNTEEIDKILITAYTDSVLLQKKDENWILNSKYKISPYAIENLFKTFLRVNLKNLAEEEFKSNQYKTVHFYSENKRIRSFEIFEIDTISSIIKIEGKKNAYYVDVMGTDLSLYNCLPLLHTYWRDKVFLQFLPSEILSLKINYSQEHGKSFHLKYEENQYKIEGKSIVSTKANRAKVNQYLSYFSKLAYDTLVMDNAFLETLNPEVYARIQLVLSENRIVKFDLYKIYTLNKKKELEFDFNYLLIYFQDSGEWAKIRYIALDPLLKDAQYFLR